MNLCLLDTIRKKLNKDEFDIDKFYGPHNGNHQITHCENILEALEKVKLYIKQHLDKFNQKPSSKSWKKNTEIDSSKDSKLGSNRNIILDNKGPDQIEEIKAVERILRKLKEFPHEFNMMIYLLSRGSEKIYKSNFNSLPFRQIPCDL